MNDIVTDDKRQLVIFSLGREEYGVSITRVQEIIRYTRPRPLPDSADFIEGVINLRGRVIPVVELSKRLGATADHPEDRKIVIAETENGAVGMTVDGVREVLTLGRDQIEPPPAGIGKTDYVDGVGKVDDRLLMLLDVEKLFAKDGLHDEVVDEPELVAA